MCKIAGLQASNWFFKIVVVTESCRQTPKILTAHIPVLLKQWSERPLALQ